MVCQLTFYTVAKNLEDCEFKLISQIIWNKQNFTFGRGDYHWKHEPCWYAVRKGHKHNWQGDRKQHTVWDISNLNPVGRKKSDDSDEQGRRTRNSKTFRVHG